MYVRRSMFVGWNNLEMFVVPPRERDVFYQVVPNMWCEHKSDRALGILNPVILSYMTDKAQPRTVLNHDLIQNMGEVEYNVMSLGEF